MRPNFSGPRTGRRIAKRTVKDAGHTCALQVRRLAFRVRAQHGEIIGLARSVCICNDTAWLVFESTRSLAQRASKHDELSVQISAFVFSKQAWLASVRQISAHLRDPSGRHIQVRLDHRQVESAIQQYRRSPRYRCDPIPAPLFAYLVQKVFFQKVGLIYCKSGRSS